MGNNTVHCNSDSNQLFTEKRAENISIFKIQILKCPQIH